uniref:Putative RNase_H superfamily protein n=1 Tax=viral metagenome TaxID=1070528 RepID=A0A6H1ZKE3_9ZZZZ
MKRLKPEGEEFIRTFCADWDKANRPEKDIIATKYGVTYGTACNWRSQAATHYPFPKVEEPRPFRMRAEDILGSRPSVNLDFVSFDLETSNLQADFSILLSAVIKPFGQEPMVYRADSYPQWENNRANDYGIVKDISDELRCHAIIITHYGERFDIPYLRAKMNYHALPILPQMFGVDTWRIARSNFKVSSRRLQNLVKYFDIGEKGGVEGGLWMDAAYSGNREAMDEIVKHNIIDCEVLEKLACITFPLLKSVKRL